MKKLGLRDSRFGLALAMSLHCLMVTGAQGGAFQNLNFESANVPYLPPGEYGDYVPIADALPGWNAYLGTTPLTRVLHNSVTLGSAAIWLWGPGYPGPRLEGNYDIMMIPGSDPFGPPDSVDVSLSQVGLVPAQAQSIVFRTQIPYSPPPLLDRFELYLGGQSIPVVTLGRTPDYVLLGGDVTRFAGVETELRFTVFWLDQYPNGLQLDAITFSQQPIPEPGMWSLFGLAALLFLGRIGIRVRRKKSEAPTPNGAA